MMQNSTTFTNLVAVAVITLLSGCAPPQRQIQQSQPAPTQSSAQQQNNLYIAAWNQSAKNSEKCLNQIKQTEYGQLVYKEVLFEDGNSSNKLELMSSKKSLSSTQAVGLKKMLADADRCRAQRLNEISSIPYLPDVIKSRNTKMDIIYSKLLARTITIGEANQNRLKVIQETDAEMTTAKQKLSKDISDRHNSEVSQNLQRQTLNAQQRAADATANAAAYQQQQQLFNNAQQLLRGDGGGQVNCYPTPGVPNSTYCR